MRGNHDRQRGVDLRRTFDEHGDEAVCTIGLCARCHDRIAVGEGLRWQLEFQQSHQVGFVQRDGAVHPLGHVARGTVAKAREQARCIGIGPAAFEREPAGAGEVVEGDHRLDAARVAAVDHRLVVIEHGDGKCAWLRLDPGPFQGKPIRVEMQGFDDIEIERPAVKTVAGIARRFGKGVGSRCSVAQPSLLVLLPSTW
jgi:hypothetical protein